MAKKKSTKKKTKKSSSKPAPRKKSSAKPPKKSSRKKTSAAPKIKKIGTGSGAPAREIGIDLVKDCNAGQLAEPYRKWYHRNIESIEADGQMWMGMKGIEAKNEWWNENFQVDSFSAEGPYVGATGFSVKFNIATTNRKTGDKNTMSEVGVYTVKNGKIVREEFMYG